MFRCTACEMFNICLILSLTLEITPGMNNSILVMKLAITIVIGHCLTSNNFSFHLEHNYVWEIIQ